MIWYENIKPTNVYPNFYTLLSANPNLHNGEECLIFFMNGNSGFGSQLTLYTQYSLYLNKINPNIICLPHFSINNENFKYHDVNYNNSFFLYFKYLKEIKEDIKCYFFISDYVLSEDKYPFIVPQSIDDSNVDDIEINRQHSTFFKNNFELKIGDHIINNINNIKNDTKIPLIGIHMRSLYQQLCHPYGRTEVSIESKLLKIKNAFDKKYIKYNVFLVTDVSDYINITKNVFNESAVFYNDFISRIDNGNVDSIINLEKYTGFKLGSDILYDCLSLIHCDYYYVSITNIAFITSYINNKRNGMHFN
jgi:hypothetical protein